MKRFTFLVLAFSVALVQSVSAEDIPTNQKQRANVTAPRVAPHASVRVAPTTRFNHGQTQQNVVAVRNQPAFRSQQYLRSQVNSIQNRSTAEQIAARNLAFRNRTTANALAQQQTVLTQNQNIAGQHNWSGQQRNWSGQQRNGNGNGNWAGNHHGNWDRNQHHRDWWRSRYNRFALFGGGYYYWNSGYWYPAYGYDPYFSTYSYDAPIYSYNDLDPGQVVASVQTELQRLGYNPGAVDGTYGPATRRALLDYQRDTGLPVTCEIDSNTLGSLGLQ